MRLFTKAEGAVLGMSSTKRWTAGFAIELQHSAFPAYRGLAGNLFQPVQHGASDALASILGYILAPCFNAKSPIA